MRLFQLPSSLLLTLIATLIVLVPASLPAQTAAPTPRQSDTRRPITPRPEASTQLAVTRVALYKNGVGFFEHSGRVTGSQSVTIDFTTAQLNDVLQSLTAIDLGGGRIAGADYNSTTPLEQQLRALPLALGLDPTAVDFYNAVRGARVEVRSGTATVIGRLLNIEVVNSPASDKQPAAEKRLITIVGDAGEVRTVELTPATEVRLLDPDLHQDVTRYLQLLASTRNQGLRHLTLQDNAPANAPAGATASRELRVSYISEVPIWKSTYRILFTTPKATSAATPAPNQTATLQGWSVVDNTTGSDWNNVQLSLIAGAPQSFIQPLSQPIYSRRPEIPIAQQAQLTPQTHESGDDSKVSVGIGSGSGSGLGAGSGGNYGGGVRRAAPAAAAQGIYGGTGQSNLNKNYVEGVSVNSSVTAADAVDQFSVENQTYQNLAFNSLTPNATSSAFDDYFAYNITEPITIRKNESALVPILQTKVDVDRVTLVSFAPNSRQATPLRALWITNTSDLTLDRGSFSIVEDGSFAGQGLLDPIHPAEKRLLSYAVDQAVRVTTDAQSSITNVTSITGSKGVLILHNTSTTEVTYVVHNAAPEARTVLIEHPIHQGYTLVETDSKGEPAPKPAETTPTLDRFRIPTPAGATLRIRVAERRPGESRYQLTNSNDNQITLILNQTSHNPALVVALQPILDARRHVADAQAALDKVNARLSELRSDEERQRANVTALASADKPSRERFVHDLNATEDQIAATQRDLTAAQTTLQSAKDDLSNKIESLQIEETL